MFQSSKAPIDDGTNSIEIGCIRNEQDNKVEVVGVDLDTSFVPETENGVENGKAETIGYELKNVSVEENINHDILKSNTKQSVTVLMQVPTEPQSRELKAPSIETSAAFINCLKNNPFKLDQLKRFIQHYDVNASWPIQRKNVSLYLDSMVQECIHDSSFDSITKASSFQPDVLRDNWEKLVMTKIHQLVFGLRGSQDDRLDKIIEFKIQKNYWIEERHLDLPFTITQDLLVIFKCELLKLNNFRAPKDKLTIIHNAMQILANCLEALTDKSAGNDFLLPSLILMLIRSNPPQLMSNIKYFQRKIGLTVNRYIKRFRNPSKIEDGPASYHLTTMISALSFVCNCKLEDLTMDVDERSARAIEIQEFLDSKKSVASPLLQQPSPNPVDIISNFASQAYKSTSFFFDSVIKEVKAVGENVSSNSTPASSVPPMSFQETQLPISTKLNRVQSLYSSNSSLYQDAPQLIETNDGTINRYREQQYEEYQLELAMALSLSFHEEQKGKELSCIIEDVNDTESVRTTMKNKHDQEKEG